MTTKVNIELDILRNPEYKNLQQKYINTIHNIKSNISNILIAGKHFERKYSIRHEKECIDNENEFINVISKVDYDQYTKMYQELLQLKRENIALKKALRENNIHIELTHIKYYGDSEMLL